MDNKSQLKAINEELKDEPFKVCYICGEPFILKRKNQVTCCSKECQNKHRSNLTMKWYRGRTFDQKDKCRQSKREYMRRKRQSQAQIDCDTLRKVKDKMDFDRLIEKEVRFREKCKGDYAEVQIAETLSLVTPIDLNIGEKK